MPRQQEEAEPGRLAEAGDDERPLISPALLAAGWGGMHWKRRQQARCHWCACACVGRGNLLALVVVGAGFFLTFAGYMAVENLNVALHGDAGFYSLVAVYGAVVPGSLLAPLLLSRCGTRAGMFIGALPYFCFGVSNILLESAAADQADWEALLIFSGAGVGAGCGVLWAGQGVYITQHSRDFDRRRRRHALAQGIAPPQQETLGLFSGVGQSSTQLGGVLALAGSTLLLRGTASTKTLYLVLAAFLGLGNMCFLVLPKSPKDRSAESLVPMLVPTTSWERVVAVPMLFVTSRKLRWLSLCFISSGYANAFMSGTFTAEVVAPELGLEYIGAVMATRNLFGIAAGVIVGRISDHTGRFPCYIATLLCEGVAAVFLSFFPVVPGGNRFGLLLALAAFMGVGNVGSCTWICGWTLFCPCRQHLSSD
eukprot:SAG22_NODE_1445_length_4406_cov_7.808684_4_plen_424_part_00